MKNPDDKQGSEQQSVVPRIKLLLRLQRSCRHLNRFDDQLTKKCDHGDLYENQQMEHSGQYVVDLRRNEGRKGPGDEQRAQRVQKALRQMTGPNGIDHLRCELPDHHEAGNDKSDRKQQMQHMIERPQLANEQIVEVCLQGS